MIAVDSSTWIAYLAGATGEDVTACDEALQHKNVVLPPVVLSELLSDPKLTKSVETLLKQVPLLSLTEGYWERVGRLRATILARQVKARLADTLIAQSCIDHRVPLITRDADFRHFVKYSHLRTIPG